MQPLKYGISPDEKMLPALHVRLNDSGALLFVFACQIFEQPYRAGA